jgi:hypothetical protein
MNDEVLWTCSETELLGLARRQGLPLLRRGIEKGDLVEIVSGRRQPNPDELSRTIESRRKLQVYISRNWGKLVGQLPGCDGRCTTYPCSEERHAYCYGPNEEIVVMGSQ